MVQMKESELTNGLKIPFEEAWRFILQVGLAAHRYGCTATRLESFLAGLSNQFGYSGVFSSTPAEIRFSLRESPEVTPRMEDVSTPAPGVDLDKLARLGELLNELKSGVFTMEEASARVGDIDRRPPPWGKFASMMGYALVGLGLAPLLGGGWPDTLFATLFSMLVYGVALLSGKLGKVAITWLPLSSAFIVGVLATLLKHWLPQLNLVLVILSAVAIILPGYTISLGAGEVVAKHVASGMANLMSGLICLVKQVAGGWLGVILTNALFPGITSELSSPVGSVWVQLLFPLLLVGLCLAFQISRRDLPWAVLVSGIAYIGVLAGSSVLNANLGNLVGTILAVVIANLWAKKTGRPTSIVLIPAIVMLVSGSIGFRGLAAITTGELLLGMQQFLQMFVVALTLLVGIFMGHALVRPEPSL